MDKNPKTNNCLKLNPKILVSNNKWNHGNDQKEKRNNKKGTSPLLKFQWHILYVSTQTRPVALVLNEDSNSAIGKRHINMRCASTVSGSTSGNTKHHTREKWSALNICFFTWCILPTQRHTISFESNLPSFTVLLWPPIRCYEHKSWLGCVQIKLAFPGLLKSALW